MSELHKMSTYEILLKYEISMSFLAYRHKFYFNVHETCVTCRILLDTGIGSGMGGGGHEKIEKKKENQEIFITTKKKSLCPFTVTQ